MSRRERLRYLNLLRQDIDRMGRLVLLQLRTALEAFTSCDLGTAESVIERDDLVDNLNLRVESRAFQMASHGGLSVSEQRVARSAVKVASNLEHAGDSATHIGKQVRIMSRLGLRLKRASLSPLSDLAVRSLDEVIKAYLKEDLILARRACQREPEIDHLYVEGMAKIAAAMRAKPVDIPAYLHLMAVLKYLEKVGDYVLNIGEQAIYLITGRRLKFGQFQQLDELLGKASAESGFAPYLDGISGAVVARVGNGVPLLYKEGSQRKIEQEVAKTAEWHRIDRNLTPKVLTTATYQDRQALLREYVDGSLLSDLYFDGTEPALQGEVTRLVRDTLRQLWTRTMVARIPQLDYVSQTEERLVEVFAAHPALRRLASARLRFRGGVCLPLRHQLDRLRTMESDLAPPFSVWLHGDFNPNNVVYSPGQGVLKFIDIHRSRFGDYLQDVTVFLVGLKREPELSPSQRRQLRHAESTILEAVREFAVDYDDRAWDRRLMLGLGRSYITSARVILQPAHAEWLFRQGRICLQKVLDRA